MAKNSERFKEILKHYKLNNRVVAAMFGVTEPYISELCTGRKEGGMNIMRLIATYFPEVNLRWYVLGDGEMLSNSKSGAIHVVSKNLLSDIYDAEDIPEGKTLSPLYNPHNLFIYLPGISSDTHGAYIVYGAILGYNHDILLVVRFVPLDTLISGESGIIVTRHGYVFGHLHWTARHTISTEGIQELRPKDVIKFGRPEKIIMDINR